MDDQFRPKVKSHFQEKIKDLVLDYVGQVCREYFFSYGAQFVTGQLQFTFENSEIIPIEFNEKIPEINLFTNDFYIKPTMKGSQYGVKPREVSYDQQIISDASECGSFAGSSLYMDISNPGQQIINQAFTDNGGHQIINKAFTGNGSSQILDNVITGNGGNGKTKEFYCEQCGRKFHQKCLLIKHIRTHTGEKPYDCAFCDKSYRHLDNLSRHTRTHTGERPFQCTQCEKSYTTDENLKIHLKTHAPDYLKVCPTCGKIFKQVKGFAKHVQSHSLVKPYRCPHCPMCYTEQYKLTVHLRSHTGEKPFKCIICDKAYLTKKNLHSHQKTHEEMFGHYGTQL